MSIFSHIINTDSGFAPNPFQGVCTLACCKPKIRKSAMPGDWVVGLTSKALGHRLVYAMRVERSMPFKDYWYTYPAKRPDFSSVEGSVGDNIYEPRKGGYKQCRSVHSLRSEKTGLPTAREDDGAKKHDLSVDRVLIGEVFTYWGAEALELPDQLREALTVGRGHRRIQDKTIVQAWLKFMVGQPTGKQGNPCCMPERKCRSRG